MTDDREFRPEVSYRRMTDPIHFTVVHAPLASTRTASGPVVAVPIVRSIGFGTERVGYLWFADHEDAAGYVASPALSPDSDNAGVAWFRRLRQAKQDGLTPGLACVRMDRGAMTDRPGFADVENAFLAGSVEELRSALHKDDVERSGT